MNPLDGRALSLREIGELADLMREKGIAQISLGDLMIHLADLPAPAPAMAPTAEERPVAEERSKLTGLTPSEEKDWFHSSG